MNDSHNDKKGGPTWTRELHAEAVEFAAKHFEQYGLSHLQMGEDWTGLGLADALRTPASAARPINQCDGCQRGLPLGTNGHHYDHDGSGALPVMACTADRYAASSELPKNPMRAECIAAGCQFESIASSAKLPQEILDCAWLIARTGGIPPEAHKIAGYIIGIADRTGP